VAGWFWAHDIKPDQVGSVVGPGACLVRLSSYGRGAARRFAALARFGASAPRSYALDVDASGLAALTGWPVSVTVSEDGLFSVVLDREGPPAAIRYGLGAPDLDALGGTVLDLATYLDRGQRAYAVVVADGAAGAGSRVVTGLTARQLRHRLRELGAVPSRLRGYQEGGELRLAAVIDPAGTGTYTWYADQGADGVAHRLEADRAEPTDLDAVASAAGPRFSAVMHRAERLAR
jgi:hypothetical protein